MGLAQWNGSVWTPIDSEKYSGINELATYKNNLIISGSQIEISGNAHTRQLAQWNGIRWLTFGENVSTDPNPVIYADSNYLYEGAIWYFGFYQDTTWNS